MWIGQWERGKEVEVDKNGDVCVCVCAHVGGQPGGWMIDGWMNG